MTRSIDDSLTLFESSLPNINTALVNQGVTSTSGLKLSQVADKIKSIELVKTGKLLIKQTVQYPTIFTWVKDSYITFVHTIQGNNKGTQSVNVIGTSQVEIELEAGSYTFKKQSTNTNFTNNFTSDSETIVIKENQTTTVEFSYIRKIGNVTFYVSGMGNNPSATSNQYSAISIHGSSDETGNSTKIRDLVATWPATQRNYSQTTSANNTLTGTPFTYTLQFRDTNMSASYDLYLQNPSTITDKGTSPYPTQELGYSRTIISLNNMNNLEKPLLDSMMINSPELVIMDNEIEEEVEYHDVYAENYTGEIIKGNLIPATQEEVEALNG